MTLVAQLRARLREAWARALRQQITWAGMAFTLAIALVALAAFLSANNLLFLILAAMLAAFLLSGFVSRMGLAGLEIDVSLPEHISARQPVRASVRVRNDKLWMPSFSVLLTGAPESGLSTEHYFPVIPASASLEEPVSLQFARRGKQAERTFQFATRFPFGFAERRELVTTRHEILIYPCLDPQPEFDALLSWVQGEIGSQVRGAGGDFYRIRPYELSESARHVDWKATAHTGDLQVREFSRERDRDVTLFLDLDVPQQHLAWFEHAVDCAAFLSFHLARRGTVIRFCTQDVDWQVPQVKDPYEVLAYLALVEPLHSRKARPVDPSDDDSLQVILTADPARTSKAGWTGRTLGPGSQY